MVMKTKVFAFIFAFIMGSILVFAADKETRVFTLDHQMSVYCEKKIKSNLRFEKGVSKIDVSLPENTITITFDPKKTDSEGLLQAFKKIGFNAADITGLDDSQSESVSGCCQGEK